eukprot:365810-Chlamydomonas_euryale.AAC.2
MGKHGRVRGVTLRKVHGRCCNMDEEQSTAMLCSGDGGRRGVCNRGSVCVWMEIDATRNANWMAVCVCKTGSNAATRTAALHTQAA